MFAIQHKLEDCEGRAYDVKRRRPNNPWFAGISSLGGLSPIIMNASGLAHELLLLYVGTVIYGAWRWAFGYGKTLRRLVSERTQSRYRVAPESSLPFVGISFDIANVTYGGSKHWDIGHVSSDPGGICFFGDFAGFTLDRERIQDVQIARRPGVLNRDAVKVTWRDDWNTLHSLYLMPVDSSSPLDRTRELARIRSALQFGTLPTALPRPDPSAPIADHEGRPMLMHSEDGIRSLLAQP